MNNVIFEKTTKIMFESDQKVEKKIYLPFYQNYLIVFFVIEARMDPNFPNQYNQPPQYQQPQPQQQFPSPYYTEQTYPSQQQYQQNPPPQQPLQKGTGQALHPMKRLEMDVGVSDGFGPMFFPPAMRKKNLPQKQQTSKHVPVIIATVLLLAAIIVVIVGANNFLDGLAIGLIIGCTYLVYILIVILASDMRGYISNLQKFEDYKRLYDQTVEAKGYFDFHIECYHYRTVRVDENSTRQEKVVTHTASERYIPIKCDDQSGDILGIKDITKYVFIHYEKKFYFTDSYSQNAFSRAFDRFVNQNRRDVHQSYYHTFQIEGFQEEIGFCALGAGSHNCVVFYLCCFLGLALPYACVLERAVSRYNINIVKRLTCQ